MRLNTSQELALDAIRKGDNVLVTGPAGCGKSHFLQLIKELFYNKGLSVTASTGIAALNVGGMTIHSWAGLGIGNRPINLVIDYILSAKGTPTRRRIRSTKILAIDEISMISAEIFDQLDQLLKGVKGNNLPFGGVQLLCFGDFLQLPPVVRENQEIFYCFESQAWAEANIKVHNFEVIYRQNDPDFLNILNQARLGKLTPESLTKLQQRVIAPGTNHDLTYLLTHNQQVLNINSSKLQALNKRSERFIAETKGKEPYISNLVKNLIVPVELELKIGAKVMVVTNSYYKEGIINGSVGTIVDFVKEGKELLPMVNFGGNLSKVIGYNEWYIEEINSEGILEKKARIFQLPLLLAWAVTIHKAQGLTIPNLYCDISRSFVAGQSYVALSRVRSIDNLFLSAIHPRNFFADSKVLNFLDY